MVHESLANYYLQTGQHERARECGESASQLAEKTDNPIGKAIATIIETRRESGSYKRVQEKILSNTARVSRLEWLSAINNTLNPSPVILKVGTLVLNYQ